MKKLFGPLHLPGFFTLPKPSFRLPRLLRWLRVLRFLKVLAIPTGLLLVLTSAVGIAVMLYGMTLPNILGIARPEVRNIVSFLMAGGLYSLGGFVAGSVLGLLFLIKPIVRMIKATFWWIVRFPKALWQSPVKTYHSVIRGRNWLLAKVEYLQSESQKWKTAFNILKSPYSLLRAAGFSPQMAATMPIPKKKDITRSELTLGQPR